MKGRFQQRYVAVLLAYPMAFPRHPDLGMRVVVLVRNVFRVQDVDDDTEVVLFPIRRDVSDAKTRNAPASRVFIEK